ncbi:hypothetical protein PMAYCL1PPCAC_31581, partial [Pristionchus mayeri]
TVMSRSRRGRNAAVPAPPASPRGEETDEEDVDGPINRSLGDMLPQAFHAAHEMARLQALHLEIQRKYDDLARQNALITREVEEYYRKLRTAEVQRDSVQSKLGVAESQIVRLQEENTLNTDVVRRNDEKEVVIMNWQNKYGRSHVLLMEYKEQIQRLEDKLNTAVNMARTAAVGRNESEKKAFALQNKLNGKNNEMKALKKHWNVIVRIIADISRQHSDDLPPSMCERLNKLPLDELLQIAKPNRGGAADSDDEDAEVIHRLLELDSSCSKSPRKGGRIARGRGSRGGRGRGGGDVVDERIHEDLLARKLQRDDDESMAALPSDSVAKSVMGRKTESVREQQERMKPGIKEKIAKMKEEQNAKEDEAKDVTESLKDAPKRGSATLDEEMMLSEDDNDAAHDDDGSKEVEKSMEDPIDFALDMNDGFDMPDYFNNLAALGNGAEEDENPMNERYSPPLGDSVVDSTTAMFEMEGEEEIESMMMPPAEE